MLSPRSILALQQTAGNAAVNHLLQRHALARQTTAPHSESPLLRSLPVATGAQREEPPVKRGAQEGPARPLEVGRREVGLAGSLQHRGVAQRQLPDANRYLTLDPTDLRLVAVGTAVDAYNQVGKKQYQQRFNRLQAVDRAIYAWFDQVSQANQRLDLQAHAPVVKDLMAAAEREHEKLIDTSKGMANVLPFDTGGMAPPEVAAMTALWQDIVNNRGDLQILGSSKYKKRVRAELAKILSTPTGRSMLAFLNAPKAGVVAGSPQAALSKIYFGEKVKNLPKAVRLASPALEARGVSEAHPLGIEDTAPNRIEDVTEAAASDLAGAPVPNPADFPAVAAGNLAQVRDAAWGGQQGFTHGGKKHTFNTRGTGAFVTSYPGQAIHPAKGTGNEILTPGWVTLGHELGHAANFRAGATTLKGSSALVDSLTGVAGSSDEWDNPEELLNIENVENALRHDSGITERQGHRPPAWLLAHATQIKKNLRQPIRDLTNHDAAWIQHPDWIALDGKIGRIPAKQLLDAALVQSLQNEVNAFLAKWTAPKFASWKAKYAH